MEGHTLLSAFVSKHVAEEVQAAVAEARGAQGMLRDDVQEICLKIIEELGNTFKHIHHLFQGYVKSKKWISTHIGWWCDFFFRLDKRRIAYIS